MFHVRIQHYNISYRVHWVYMYARRRILGQLACLPCRENTARPIYYSELMHARIMHTFFPPPPSPTNQPEDKRQLAWSGDRDAAYVNCRPNTRAFPGVMQTTYIVHETRCRGVCTQSILTDKHSSNYNIILYKCRLAKPPSTTGTCTQLSLSIPC